MRVKRNLIDVTDAFVMRIGHQVRRLGFRAHEISLNVECACKGRLAGKSCHDDELVH